MHQQHAEMRNCLMCASAIDRESHNLILFLQNHDAVIVVCSSDTCAAAVYGSAASVGSGRGEGTPLQASWSCSAAGQRYSTCAGVWRRLQRNPPGYCRGSLLVLMNICRHDEVL